MRVEDFPGYCQAVAAAFADDPLATSMAECESILAAGFAGNFAARQDSGGVPWPARRDSKPHPLLQLTGALLASTQRVSEATHRALTFTALGSRPYEKVHQYGYPPKNIPAREYLYATEVVVDQAATAIAEDFLRRAFL